MKGVLLRLCLGCFLAILCSLVVKAQNFRFIYIQTEDQKPFYTKMDGQSTQSASSGYVIIPRLTEGTYRINVGFPQSTLPELLLTIVLNEADAGYLIRKDLDQGVYVVDLQTMKFVATEIQWPVAKTRALVKSNDAFARILSEVVNDSSINEIPVLTKYETTSKADVIKASVASPLKPAPVVKSEQQSASVENKATISKLGQRNTTEAVLITYLDNADTITVVMPVKAVAIPMAKEEIKDTQIVTKNETQSVKDVRFIDMGLQNPNQQRDSGYLKNGDFVITEKKNTTTLEPVMNQRDSIALLKKEALNANTTCKKAATQADFLDLRKKMAAEKTEAAMRILAGKQFVSLCFTTDQVKNLGTLFTTEEERYNFYVASYPYVLDIENFGTLESQLADSYYITRFKAMLNH